MEPLAYQQSPPLPADIVDVRLEQANRDEWSAQAGSEWRDAEALHAHLSSNTNHMDAVERVPWDDMFPKAAVVLDLGCGAGWLTAILTRHERVKTVIAWDLSPPLLADVLPAMVLLMSGDFSKVQRVCGSFTPLLLEDHSIDVAVMSSAFHHASDRDTLLDELTRVVRPNGTIALLNEVPYSTVSLLAEVGSTSVAAVVNGLSSRLTVKKRGHVAADHVLYDDVLGDRALTSAQWRRLFRAHDLDVEIIDTSLPPYPRHFRRQFLLEKNLTHFLLRRRP